MLFIFEARIKPGHSVKEYVDAWNNGSSIIQKEPGAKGTKLHRKTGEKGVLLAIAEWESKAARDQAMTHLKEVDSKTREILDKHATIADITVIGNFEDSEWHVSPEGQYT